MNCKAAPPVTATASLTFSVTVPAFVFLRVGTGGAPVYGTSSTIDSLVFNVPATAIGSGAAVAARASDGDGGNGTLTAQAHCTVGSMQVSSSVSGPLTNAQGNTIPWSQIAVTFSQSAGSLGNANFPTSATVQNGWSVNFANTVWADGKWTFSYLNQAVVRPGTYGGTVARNGRITYTATAL